MEAVVHAVVLRFETDCIGSLSGGLYITCNMEPCHSVQYPGRQVRSVQSGQSRRWRSTGTDKPRTVVRRSCAAWSAFRIILVVIHIGPHTPCRESRVAALSPSILNASAVQVERSDGKCWVEPGSGRLSTGTSAASHTYPVEAGSRKLGRGLIPLTSTPCFLQVFKSWHVSL